MGGWGGWEMADIVDPSVLPLIVQLACVSGGKGKKKKKDTATEESASAEDLLEKKVLRYRCSGDLVTVSASQGFTPPENEPTWDWVLIAHSSLTLW